MVSALVRLRSVNEADSYARKYGCHMWRIRTLGNRFRASVSETRFVSLTAPNRRFSAEISARDELRLVITSLLSRAFKDIDKICTH